MNFPWTATTDDCGEGTLFNVKICWWLVSGKTGGPPCTWLFRWFHERCNSDCRWLDDQWWCVPTEGGRSSRKGMKSNSAAKVLRDVHRQKMNLWNMNFVSSSPPSFYYITILKILQLSEICRNLFMFSLAQGQMRWDELRWKSVNAMELEDGSIWVYVRCSLALNARLVTVPTYTLCLA